MVGEQESLADGTVQMNRVGTHSVSVGFQVQGSFRMLVFHFWLTNETKPNIKKQPFTQTDKRFRTDCSC